MDETTQLVLRGICRGLHLAGYFTAFGAMFLAVALLRGVVARGLKRVVWAGFALAFLAGTAWFLLQTAYFASAQDFADVFAALPLVAQDTRFGGLLLGRLAVLFLAVLLFQANRQRLAALFGFGVTWRRRWYAPS